MAHAHCPDHCLDEVGAAWDQRRNFGSEGRHQGAGEVSAVFDAKDVDPHDVFVEVPVLFDNPRRQAQEMWDAGISTWKLMIVDLRLVGVIKDLCSKLFGGFKLHVAFITIVDGLFGVVEARYAMPRNAAEEIRIVVVLAPQKLIVIQFLRQVYGTAWDNSNVGRGIYGLSEQSADLTGFV